MPVFAIIAAAPGVASLERAITERFLAKIVI
jgi:hypothetical protein